MPSTCFMTQFKPPVISGRIAVHLARPIDKAAVLWVAIRRQMQLSLLGEPTMGPFALHLALTPPAWRFTQELWAGLTPLRELRGGAAL